jgi:hypothetical protein
MTTLSDLRDRVLRVVNDPSSSQFTADTVNDGILAALEAILPWISKPSIATLVGDAEETEFELPTDIYRITAVFDGTSGTYLPENVMAALKAPGDNEANNDWMQYPSGSISFANAPENDVTVYYGAVWGTPVDDDDAIESPTWADRALVFYAASYALLERASSSANIRQWNVQVDSGTPVMNPMRDMSSYFLERFRIEMERMPHYLRGVHG